MYSTNSSIYDIYEINNDNRFYHLPEGTYNHMLALRLLVSFAMRISVCASFPEYPLFSSNNWAEKIPRLIIRRNESIDGGKKGRKFNILRKND